MKYLKWTIILLILVFLAGIFEPFYYKAKAQVAQRLLERSWQNAAVKGLTPDAPWPWADFKAAFLLTAGSEQFIVSSDASGESLAFAPGLLTPDIQPGSKGNSLIAAHRDTHFSFLRELKIDDLLEIQTVENQVLNFIVDQIQIVDANLEQPLTQMEQSRLTLITCYPFDSRVENPHLRYLVSAVLIESGFNNSF